MAVYIVFFALFFCSAMLEVGGLKKSQAKWLLGGLTVILILFVGLRFHTGADWFIYHQIFDASLSSQNNNPHNTEYGYLLLNKLFKYVFDNYYVMQFAVTMFVGISTYRLYKRYSEYPIVSLSLFVWMLFYTILMAQVRQSIALAIIIFATPYIFDRKPLRFLIAIIAASFFHISAVVAIPLYFLYKNYGKTVPVILMLSAQIFYFFPEITEIIVRAIAPYLPGRLSGLAEIYMESYFIKQQEFGTGLFYFGQMIFSVFVFLFIKPKDKKTAFFLNTLVIFVIIRGFAIGLNILERLEAYYLVYAIIAYTYLFDVRIKRLRNLYLATACVFLLFFAAPFVRGVVNSDIVPLTNRPANYAIVPYYNVLWHPPEAKQRKDWVQR